MVFAKKDWTITSSVSFSTSCGHFVDALRAAFKTNRGFFRLSIMRHFSFLPIPGGLKRASPDSGLGAITLIDHSPDGAFQGQYKLNKHWVYWSIVCEHSFETGRKQTSRLYTNFSQGVWALRNREQFQRVAEWTTWTQDHQITSPAPQLLGHTASNAFIFFHLAIRGKDSLVLHLTSIFLLFREGHLLSVYQFTNLHCLRGWNRL